MTSNPLSTIYFIKLPEGASLSERAIKIDPSIELPVQKKDADSTVETDFKKLSQEQILSGILTVLAYDTENPNNEYYRKIITEVRPNIKVELAEAAVLKTRNEDWDLAEEIWMAVKGIDPNDMAVVLNMAVFFDQRADSFRANTLYEDADAYDAFALEYYRKAVAAEPEIPDAFFNVGFFYLKKKNYSEAKGSFETYLALIADEKDDKLGESGIYKKERAQEIIDKISNRSLEDSRISEAYNLINTDQDEKGLEVIQKFIRDNPRVWNAWFILGWGLRKMCRFNEAKQAFLKAREFDEGDETANVLNELAICQMETGEFDAAKETLVEAMQLDPDNIKVISNLGCLYQKSGDIEEAKRYFRIVLELDPNDKIAASMIDSLEN